MNDMELSWPKFALAWTAVAAGALLVRAIGMVVAGHSPTFEMAATDVALIAIWAAVSPLVFLSASRFPVVPSAPLPNAAIHLLLGSLFIVASNLVIRLPMLSRSGIGALIANTGSGIATYYPGAIVCYAVLVAIGQRLGERAGSPGQTEESTTGSSAEQPHAAVIDTLNPPGEPPQADRLVIREWNRVHLIALDDIEWIEADNNHVVVHAGARDYKGRERISDVEARLDERRFVRVHRSAIVHVAQIREVQPLARGDHAVILRSGRVVRVARTRKQSLESALGLTL